MTVQFYGPKGKLEESYHFCKAGDAGWGDLPEGWFDDEEAEVKDKDIDFGKGFFSNTASGDNKIVYSGEVDVRATAIPVTSGLSMMGNFRPTQIQMSDIKVVDEDDNEVSNAVTLQFYGSKGKLIESYHYCKAGDAGWGDLPAGWFDDEEAEVKDKTLEAGVGFMAQGNGAKVFLKFPKIGE